MTAAIQITFHDANLVISHFTTAIIGHSRLTKIPFYYPQIRHESWVRPYKRNYTVYTTQDVARLAQEGARVIHIHIFSGNVMVVNNAAEFQFKC